MSICFSSRDCVHLVRLDKGLQEIRTDLIPRFSPRFLPELKDFLQEAQIVRSLHDELIVGVSYELECPDFLSEYQEPGNVVMTVQPSS